jgi:hypothetical protein
LIGQQQLNIERRELVVEIQLNLMSQEQIDYQFDGENIADQVLTEIRENLVEAINTELSFEAAVTEYFVNIPVNRNDG